MIGLVLLEPEELIVFSATPIEELVAAWIVG